MCTPDFFGYNADLKLQYRARIDAGGKDDPGPAAKRELFEEFAMRHWRGVPVLTVASLDPV